MTEHDDIDLEGWNLHRAAEENRIDIARSLIARGDNIEAQNEEEETPLHSALNSENLDIVRLLLDQGANVDAETWSGISPLQEQANWGILAGPMLSPEIALLLIEDGASTKGTDLSWLDRRLKMEEQGLDPAWNLQDAARKNRADIVRSLIALGDEVEAKNAEGGTPLHVAAAYNSLDVVRGLIEHGANIEAKNNGGRTPLHRAVRKNFLDVARLLVEHGANTDDIDLSWMNKNNRDGL